MRRHRAGVALVIIAALTLSLPPATAVPRAPAAPSPSIEATAARTLMGGELALGRTLAATGAWTKRAVSWEGDGLRLTGTATIPRGPGAFPVMVLAHGYIDPRIYTTGRGFAREQDWLARNGVVAFHVDYRNHAGSDDDPRAEVDGRLGYAVDVITAAMAIRQARPSRWDVDRIALMGRSMGGGVTMAALAIRPGLFDAGILYASVSSLAAENFDRWQRNRYPLATRIAKEHGLPEENPSFWAGISPRTSFARIDEPVLMFHGTADATCPIRWARATRAAMERAGVDLTYTEYAGEGHTFYGSWAASMRTTLRFLEQKAGWA